MLTAEVHIPFEYKIVDGTDPSRCSSTQKAFTKSINLSGMVFRTSQMLVDSLHLSFADGAYGRNMLEVVISLGGKFEKVQFLAQVEWYEKQTTATEDTFIVGLGFVDVQADAAATLRDFLKTVSTTMQPLKK